MEHYEALYANAYEGFQFLPDVKLMYFHQQVAWDEIQ